MAEKLAKPEWQHGPSGRASLEGDGFYISYNPCPGALLGISFFASDDGRPETALCYDGRYDILNGDFRDSYERLVPQGLAACRAFYMQQSAHADSSWTTPSKIARA